MKFLKRFIIFDVLIVVLCGILAFFFFSNILKSNKTNTDEISQTTTLSPVPAVSISKVWQIVLSFNTQTQQVTLSKISIKPGTATASPYTNSPYQLTVLDKDQHVLFRTDIAISQQILYDIYFPAGATPSGLPQLDHFDSLVTVPYLDNGKTIRITKDKQTILQFSPPKEISVRFPSLIQQAEAATCGLLHIVFVSDGYTNMAKFHVDVQKAEATFLSKAPFASHPNIFDFQTIDNPASNPLGCKQNGNLQIMCVETGTNLTKISQVVFTAFPQLPQDNTYTKIVILVDGAPQPVGGGFILGVANAIGGQFGVFQNQLFFEATATMEVLGHDVGHLYDRYLYPQSPPGQVTAADIGNTIPAPFLSNCTTNSHGETFWKNAGVTQAYKGCTSQYLYAPAPLDCGSQGSHSTIMSAAGCAGPQFDGVEQYYITSQILPNYCGASPIATFTPIPTTSSQKYNILSPSVTIPFAPSNPAPTYKTFDCQLDPSCTSNQKTLQLCPLKCTPK